MQPQITDMKERIDVMTVNQEAFKSYIYQIVFLCGAMLYSVSLKILFNTCEKGAGKNLRVPIDRWSKFDIVTALITLLGFLYIIQSPPVDFVTKEKKDMLDYLMLVMIMCNWGRFYLFFLMISELSKMLLTFIAMVIDTMAFMFIVASYLIVVSAIFTTVF